MIRRIALGLFVLLVALGCHGRPSPTRVLLIGIEGVSWDELQAMITAGEAPNFARLKSEGAWGVLESDDPVHPAGIWATIATGRTEAQHTVRFPVGYDAESGRLQIPSRSAAAVWEITTRRKIASGVIGWPYSAPIPKEVHTRVDDLAFYRGLGLVVPFPGTILPVPAFDAAQSPFVKDGGMGSELSARIEAASLAQMPELAAKAWPKLRLLAVYLDGANSARHYAGAVRAMGVKEPIPQLGKESRKHMRRIDLVLGQLLDLADPQTLVMVATDDPNYMPSQSAEGDFVHPVHGIVGLIGPQVVAGKYMENPTILDFVPMALTHLGVPTSEEMPGNPFLECWSAPPAKLPKVASYDVFIRRPYPPGGALDDLDAVWRVGELRAIAKTGNGPFNDRNIYALDLLAEGNLRGAWAEAMIDINVHSANPVTHYVMGEVLLAQDKPVLAMESFLQAAELLTPNPPGEPQRTIRLMVGLALAGVQLSIRQPEAAAEQLRLAMQLCEDCTRAVVMLARCDLELDDPDRAISILTNALRKKPDDADLLIVLGQAKARSNDLKGARQAWESAIGKARRGPLQAHLELGLLSIRERNWENAEHHLEIVTELDPQNVYVWFQLASVYSNENRDQDAERALLACLRADPDQELAWLAWRKIKQADGESADADSMLAAAREAIAERAARF